MPHKINQHFSLYRTWNCKWQNDFFYGIVTTKTKEMFEARF